MLSKARDPSCTQSNIGGLTLGAAPPPIPAESEFQLVEMGEEEAAERELQSRRIHQSRETLSAVRRGPGQDKPGQGGQ
jgi:hypothetical protein